MNPAPAFLVRQATKDDLGGVTDLTRARRHQLALWEPWYWNPRDGIDETHPMYLRWCIEHNPNCDVLVATEHDLVVGCVFVSRRPDHAFLDDFCVVDDRWPAIGAALANASTGDQRLVCAPAKDNALHHWLQASEFRWASSFFSLNTRNAETSEMYAESVPLPSSLDQPPAHVFGSFDASTDNGLKISTADGYAIGSAPAVPAAYDPGGPTTVVDRVCGPNRRNVVQAVLHEASRRGDVQVIVVVDHADDDLKEILVAVGATQPVNLWCASSTSPRERSGRLAS